MVVKILQWFVTTVALLTLTVMQACASGILVVKPTNESACPQQPCHTLEHYAHRWQFYLTSNTIMKFLPGEHVLKGDWSTLFLVNVSNLTLIGNNDMSTGNLVYLKLLVESAAGKEKVVFLSIMSTSCLL